MEDWLSSEQGMSKVHYEEMEAFFDAHSADAPTPGNILTHGLPWGGLHEKLTGRKLAPGVVFDTPEQSLAAARAEGAASLVPAALQPWAELLGPAGTFSNATLGRLPGSFQVSAAAGKPLFSPGCLHPKPKLCLQVAPAWYSALEASAAAHGDSWLHKLFMGTIELERAHSSQAAASLAASHKMRPNPHAARALALLAPTQAEAWARYLEGWASLSPASGTDTDTNEDPMRKPVMDALAREMCEFCRATGMLAELKGFLPTVPQVWADRSPAT